MKKKTLIITITSVFVLAAIITLLIFVFSGNPTADVKSVNLNGTWKVAAQFSNDSASLPENEFMVFTDDTATAHRDGAAIATSKYEFSNGTNLKLPDISREYTVERKTDNHIRFYESAAVYMDLIRYPNDDLSTAPVDTAKLYGKWNVTYRNSATPIADEVICFTETEIEDYRGDSANPAAVSAYSWSSPDTLFAEKWGTQYQLIQFADNTIFFIEKPSGLVWELTKAS